MYREPAKDAQGKITSPVSTFNPTQEEKDATAEALSAFVVGSENQSRPRREFNDRSLIQEIDENYRAFNSYVPPKSEDPDESWRAQTVRPLTRNKLISMAAHVTQSILYPGVTAQDHDDNEDQLVAEVMKDMIEWSIDHSDYERQFIQAAITMLVEPAVIVESNFYEVYRMVRDKPGSVPKKVLDEVLSGFRTSVIPSQEILIANFYEPDIQKQRFVIRNRFIDFSDAQAMYGDHKNFKYVMPGSVTVFDATNSTFYDVKETDVPDYLVNETIYECRAKDLRLVFINGILVTAPDQPNPRLDKLYGYAKGIYEPINNGTFFYGKPGASKLASDQAILDTLYNMVLDGTFLQLMPPMAAFGSEDIDTGVYLPGTVTSFRDPMARLESVGPRSDVRAGLEAIGLVEKSMAESSQDPLQAGNAMGGERTAREVLVMQQNAKTAMGLFGKQIAFLVEDIGRLRVGEICQYATAGEVKGVAGEMKYKSFVVENKMADGSAVSRKIEFSGDMLDSDEKSDEDLRSMSYDLFEKEKSRGDKVRIRKVNPRLFREMKYRIVINADELTPRSQALQKALDLEGYDRMIQNPHVDQRAVTRDFLLNALRPGSGEKYLAEGQSMGAPAKGTNQNTSFLSQITGSNSLGVAASTDMGQSPAPIE